MMFLHYSNRLENLLEPLAESIARSQARDPITQISIVVPNRAVEQFVKYRLAERLGVAANLNFPFLRSFLAQVVERADPKIRVLEADAMRTLLFESLRSEAAAASPALAPVHAYLDVEPAADARRELRLFRLADRLARLIREYSISRTEMLAGWPRRSRLGKNPSAGTERWQRELWGLVFDDRRAVSAALVREPEIKCMLLPFAMEAVPPDALRRALPDEIHIFALPNAGPAYVKIFADLARLKTLNVYALNPCLEFWEDLQTAGAIDRARMIHRRDRIEAPFVDDLDRFHLLDDAENRALTLWGRPGREYIRLLNQLSDCDFDDRFVRLRSGRDATLLETLQDDILMRAPSGESAPADRRRFADDASIRIFACPGIRREAEVVANAIWSVLKESAGNAPIRFHEIAVLIPDASLGSYLPHLESVFERQHRIPLEIANRRFVQQSRVAEAVELLLALPLGRFTRDEVIRLLTHPAVIGGDSELEFERWAAWCAEAGVVFGADREHLRNTYLSGDLYHWDQALRRMALGVFMTGERSGDLRLAKAGDGAYLPLELGQDAGDSVMRLVRLARGMIADALALGAAQLTLPEWSRAITAYISKYVQEGDDEAARVRGWCLRAIAGMAPADLKVGAVGYEIAREVASGAIGASESTHGQIRGRGIAVGSMDALRSIPFRAIFVMGLAEATFPARERGDPLDLRLGARSAGDVTPSERDRYLFLEALLAARDRVFLSYVNRNPQTGETLEPSAVLRELEYILRGYLDKAALENLTISHPVSRYDLSYFRDLPHAPSDGVHPELKSFDSDALRGAKMASLRKCVEEAAKPVPLPGRDDPLIEFLPDATRPALRRAVAWVAPTDAGAAADAAAEEIAISLAALRRYLECPLQGAARYALGLNDEDDHAEESAEDEPLQRSALDRVMLLREIFERISGSDDSALDNAWRAGFEIAEMHGRAPAGVFKDAARTADRAALEQWHEQARQAGAGDPKRFAQVRMGADDEFARADETLDPLILDVRITGPDDEVGKRRVRIQGSLGLFRRGRKRGPFETGMLAVARDEAKASDFLRLALGLTVLAAAGQPIAAEFNAVVVTSAEKFSAASSMRQIAAPSPARARKYLEVLVSDLLSRGNDYFLPIEAIEKARQAIREDASHDELLDAVENVRDGEGDKTRTAYGPVRDAWLRFEAPAGDEIVRIVRRRYDPIGWIFPEPRARRAGGAGR
jgi:exodeoxyribonuclease V gamma subunit